MLTTFLVAPGCGGSKKTSSEGTTTTIAGVSANDHGTKQVASSGSTEVELYDYYFKPTILKGTPGQKVTLELKNEGSVEHNFTIESQHVNQDIEAGTQKTVTVTIPQSGQVSFYCKYHKSQGMAGALEGSSSGY